jgi:hypothetical protein
MARLPVFALCAAVFVSLSACDTTQYEEFTVPTQPGYTSYTTSGSSHSDGREAHQHSTGQHELSHNGEQPCLTHHACGT